jgi:hypothetical protein
MNNVKKEGFVIGQGIVYYTNIYTHLDDLIDGTKTLDWYE